MPTLFIHSPAFRWLSPIVFGIMAYVTVLLVFDSIEQLAEVFFSGELLLCIIIAFLLFEGLRALFILLERRMSWKGQRLYRIGLQLLASLMVSLAVVSAVVVVYFIYVVGYSSPGSFSTELVTLNATFGVGTLLYNLLFLSQRYLQIENTGRLEAEKLKRDRLEYQLRAFSQEMNPTLLYESMESLIGLVYRSVDEADDFVGQLSTLYRYMLENRQHELVPLAQELNIAPALLHLLNVPYRGLLSCKQQALPPNHSALQVVPGTMALLLEYIVRNTIVNEGQPLAISAYVEEDYLVLQHALNDRLMPQKAKQQQLEALQAALAHFTTRPLVQVKAYNEQFIKVPLLTEAADANEWAQAPGAEAPSPASL